MKGGDLIYHGIIYIRKFPINVLKYMKDHLKVSFYASNNGINRFAISSTTGTDTALPASLYKFVSDIIGNL